MATIISSQNIQNHDIDKYNFKIFALGSDSTSEVFEESNFIKNESAEKSTKKVPQATTESINSKDKLIESLMEKTDEMSSNFIKLQMKLESKDEEHSTALKKAKEQSFNEGVESGLKKAATDSENSLAHGLSQFSSSVASLEESAKEFDSALDGVKSELMSAAIDIAKEVIGIEISQNSNNIAKILSDELIKELQSASKITLRVNPKNHGFISEHVGSLEHIEVLSDSAVNEGGVVAISDVGNIDAQVSKRFQKVKKAALGE